LQYYVSFGNRGLTRDPEQGTKSKGKKSAIKSRKRYPHSNPEEKIRNQIQERNPQSNPGKEIRNQIQEKKSAKSNPRSQNSSSVSG
jgi:hypothetical protein